MSIIKPILQRPEQIAYFTGANNYCWLHFRSGEKKLLAKPISYIEDKLPDFIRVHKTSLVNPAYVQRLHQPANQKMAGTIQLDNGDQLPVSRRRCQQVAEQLEQYRAINQPETTLQEAADVSSQLTADQPQNPLWSIILITTDTQNNQLLKQTLEKKWPRSQVHSVQQSTQLPDVLSQLSQSELPTLLLLDARTTTLERLRTLQRLKENGHLRRIPVILLVQPSDQAVTDGYQHQANSVISMSVDDPGFARTVERICQFWLRTAALPGMDE